ncbi:TonB-dependent receptor [Steroidobacter cummioxidans]|uniref:TonB-dependent receptor n=1 Tax=Steroidobacter cummioxidans TaxID=1803913 RepID=UPI000E3175C8|nr:TonB-dependent receptor [Steroidobacter cummioxidans]
MLSFRALTTTLALAVATPVLAQTTSGDSRRSENEPSSGNTNVELREIDVVVVTARRREEDIRDVPGTISAVTAEQLEAKGPIAGSGDLLSTVPGVRFNDVASENLAEVSIRGSGTQRATGADSGVGLFVNGAYAGSSTLGGRNFKTLDYFDLERVEVFEGPQGALYGRNSEFGVVNIILAKPKFQNSGYVRNMWTFDLDQNRLAGVMNQVLSDEVAVRVGAEHYNQTGGFYYDPNHDKYYDSSNGFTARGQIRYRSGPLDVTLLVDGQDLELPTFVNSLLVPGGGVNAQIPRGYQQSRFILPHTGRDGMQQKVKRTMLMATYELNDNWTIESTTMATDWTSRQQYAAAIDVATAIEMRQQGQIGIWPYGQVMTDVRDRTLYQDLHFTGKTSDGSLSWIVGAEGLFQRDDYQLLVASSPCPFTLAGSFCSGTPIEPVCVRPLPTSINCPTPFPLIYGTDARTKQRISSYAGYASLQYAIGDFTLVGEGRFANDSKRATQGITALYTDIYTKVPTTYTFNASEPAYTFTASYKVPSATNTLVYAKVGTGYRAGGVNNGTFNAAAPNPFVATYDNENTIGYEAGVKTNITSNVFVRLSGYLSRTTDAITSINDGCTVTNACGVGGQFFTVNGGTIEAHGIEASVDSRFRIGAGLLSTNLSAATQKAEFEKVPTSATGLPIQGTPVAQIPDWTYSAMIDYRQPITQNVNGFINVSYSGQRGGGQDTVTVATPFIPLEDFDIFGARAGVNFDNVQVAAFVRNFTDQEVEVLKFFQAGYPLSSRYNKPRTVGLSVTYNW